MALELYAMTCGWLNLPLAVLIEGGSADTIRIPVPCYLIVHPSGTALFDSGLGTVCLEEDDEYLGDFAALMQVEFAPGEEIAMRLETLEREGASIDFLINSHLHFDHAGGNEQIPDARLIVQKREWEAAHEPDQIAAMGYKPVDYDLGHDLLLVDGEHDVFGDGSVTCIPTHGHTPGHQSLRVALPDGEVVLTGDACYLRESLEQLRRPPGAASDREAMLGSLKRLRTLQSRGARIFYGHDPGFWQKVPQAPARIT
ncbi:MAG: MBL fold metallo-hydrolase [Deltaproteobacteria bacterium]|nr:MBL fold metallo-hydrolase [Deltaproteobacteria bacterium]